MQREYPSLKNVTLKAAPETAGRVLMNAFPHEENVALEHPGCGDRRQEPSWAPLYIRAWGGWAGGSPSGAIVFILKPAPSVACKCLSRGPPWGPPWGAPCWRRAAPGPLRVTSRPCTGRVSLLQTGSGRLTRVKKLGRQQTSRCVLSRRPRGAPPRRASLPHGPCAPAVCLGSQATGRPRLWPGSCGT